MGWYYDTGIQLHYVPSDRIFPILSHVWLNSKDTCRRGIQSPFPEMSENSWQNYAVKLKARLKWAYKVARETNEKESARHKKYYDKKYRCMKILPGDLVLIRLKAFDTDHKIADHWEQIPYEVVDQIDKGPVYKVRTIQGQDSTKVRTLHCNMLFPLQSKRENICTAASEP